MKSIKFYVLILIVQLAFVPRLFAQRCSNLFLNKDVQQTQFSLTEQQLLTGSILKSLPHESIETVRQALKRHIQSANIMFLPAGTRFAISISRQNKIHLVSEGLTKQQHHQLLLYLQSTHAEQLLTGVHPLFRNKYFEIEVLAYSAPGSTVHFQITSKLTWDLIFPTSSQFVSQFVTGFGLNSTDQIVPYAENKIPTTAKVRKDLLNQKITQETLATCGLASIIKILKSRQINYSERDLLEIVESRGIRTLYDIFGEKPGLTLAQLAQLLQGLGLRHGFTVREVIVTTDNDLSEFQNMALKAAEGKTTDVIVNYSSPIVGRPGAGHFTPIGGYNSKTKTVLLSEVNLSMNPAFWTSDKNMIKAMKETDSDKNHRGYLVITWNDL